SGEHLFVDLFVGLDGHDEFELFGGHFAFFGGTAVVGATAAGAAAALQAGATIEAGAAIFAFVAGLSARLFATLETVAAFDDSFTPVWTFGLVAAIGSDGGVGLGLFCHRNC